MAHGYNGKILHVDLSTHQFTIEEPPEEFYRKYLGGSAINSYYLYKLVPKGTDPLSEENVLAISVAVTTGAPIAGQSRVCIGAKSPLTGLIGDSQSGGFFPAEMKYAGFDAFIIRGRSETPVYLWVNDGKVELRDASHLWGKITGDAEDLIWEELGDPSIKVIQIGPAGENGLRYANIMNNCNRANGRTGMGAVMGSKNLKAIAVRGKNGKKQYKVANREKLNELRKVSNARLKESGLNPMGKYGTAIMMASQDKTGQLPTYNFSSGTFKGVEKISGDTQYNTILRGASEGKQDGLGRDTCYACPVRCKRVVEINRDDMSVDPRYGGPEYETLAMMGSNCGIDDLAAIAKANELCGKYGVDTISCGGTIAWAMDCFEKGLISEEDTGGLVLKFGNVPAYLEMVELICKQEGFGAVLAEGSVRAAEIIGRGTEKLTVASNGQEFPAHMPRVKVSMGINYATNPYGACHMTAGHDPRYEQPESQGDTDVQPAVSPVLQMLNLTSPTPPRSLNSEKVRHMRITEDYHSAMDSLCWCMFIGGTMGGLHQPDDIPEIINSVTGWDMTLDELLEVGERKFNLMRLFNAREGYDLKKDVVAERLFEPLKGGVTDGLKLDRDECAQAIKEFYIQRGWDPQTGNPTEEKIDQLGLEWVRTI
jgi:aldehyde:ferredoxin oxidoreductase